MLWTGSSAGRGVDEPLVGDVDGERVTPGKLGVVPDIRAEDVGVGRQEKFTEELRGPTRRCGGQWRLFDGVFNNVEVEGHLVG